MVLPFKILQWLNMIIMKETLEIKLLSISLAALKLYIHFEIAYVNAYAKLIMVYKKNIIRN